VSWVIDLFFIYWSVFWAVGLWEWEGVLVPFWWFPITFKCVVWFRCGLKLGLIGLLFIIADISIDLSVIFPCLVMFDLLDFGFFRTWIVVLCGLVVFSVGTELYPENVTVL